MNKLYIKFEKPRTVLEFLKIFYCIKPSSNIMKAVPTYYDRECTKVQCNKYWRGFDDMFILIKTYYPTISKQKFLKILLKYYVIHNKKYYSMNFGICYGAGICRMMPYQPVLANSNINTIIPKNSKYSWVQLFNLIGIKDNKELFKIQKKQQTKILNNLKQK